MLSLNGGPTRKELDTVVPLYYCTSGFVIVTLDTLIIGCGVYFPELLGARCTATIGSL